VDWIYEPGPVALLDPARVFAAAIPREFFEPVVTPIAAQFTSGDQYLVDAHNIAASGADVNLDPEFDPDLGIAEGEVGFQLGNLSEIDPGPAIAGTLETIDEVARLAGEAPPEGISVPTIELDPRTLAENPLGDVTYQEAGDGGTPPEP